jgi:hypothetical protein
VFVHALSGAASFAAALKLFRTYPLAVSPWSDDGWQRSLVLRYGSGFFVLSQDPARALRAPALGRRGVSGDPAGRAGARRRPPR